MSSGKPVETDHVDLVKQLYAAFFRRDIDAIVRMLSNDVEWGEPDNPFNPTGGTRHGHAGFLEWARIGQQSEEILTIEPRLFLTNDTSVAVVGFTKCVAKTTGRSYESDFVHLITFRDRQVVRFQEFFDTYAAGEAFRTESRQDLATRPF